METGRPFVGERTVGQDRAGAGGLLGRLAAPASLAFLVVSLVAFLAIGAYQLSLPGLHYDEAKEAGLNAMQLVMGQPLTAFRDATIQLGPWRLPLMVQDYIGALNPILATPFLALARLNSADPTRGVVALRWLPLLTGALTLLLAWLVALRLGGRVAASITAGLLAVNPAFVFWSRQGIFVTNITALFFMASLLTGIRWWQARRPRDLWLTALFWGLGLYAKLLFIWAIGAMTVVAVIALIISRPRRSLLSTKRPALAIWLIAGVCFLFPLIPLILFNLRTGGTFASIFGNLGQSYYGVNNRAYFPNLQTRISDFGALLRGDFFWYLGEVFANPWSTTVAAVLTIAAWIKWGVCRARGVRISTGNWLFLPIALLVLIVAQSAFTVSDLFITHYVLLLPLIPLSIGLSAAALIGRWPAAWPGKGIRALYVVTALGAIAGFLLWGYGDLRATIKYHRVLTISGGYGGHSDAVIGLAKYLSGTGPSAPLALDWGMDAPLRFLTLGRVNPIEVFGYSSTAEPDPGFADRVTPFFDNPDNVYIAHVADQTVFRERVEALAKLAQARGYQLSEEQLFRERNGRPVFIVIRVVRP